MRRIFLFSAFLIASAAPAQLSQLPAHDTTVFPLPADDSVTFCLGPLVSPDVSFSFSACNSVYCKYVDYAVADSAGNVTLDVSCLPAGVYEIEILYDGKTKLVLLPVQGPSQRCMRMVENPYWEEEPREWLRR